MTEHNENTMKPLETDLPLDDVLAGLPKDLLEPYDDGTSPAAEASDETDFAEKRRRQREDRWLITLMAIASVLCAGIIGVLIFWLNAYLK